MNKIKIEDNKFTCPMRGVELKLANKELDKAFASCGKCKFNVLGQLLDGYVYCNYGSSSGGGGGGDDSGGGGTDPDDPTPQPYYPDLDINDNGEPDEFWEDYNG